MTPRPTASCPCRCRTVRSMCPCSTVRSMRCRRPPRRRASIRPSKDHVARVCFKCFRCLILMLQVFHLYAAKVDRNVAHVEVAIHVCFKCMFQMFHLVFQTYVCKCSSRCCISFHTYVASVSSGCCVCLQMVFNCIQVFFKYLMYVSIVSAVSYVCSKCFI